MSGRRAVLRWAWRLYRREWRQQALVLALLTVAVTATVLGAAVATNTPSTENAASFGTADHLVSLPGKDSGAVAAMAQRFGPVQVIARRHLSTGTTGGVELRAQDPTGPYGRPMLALVAGRYPTGPDEVAMTRQVANLYDLGVGGTWHGDAPGGGVDRRVVGLVENPSNLLDAFALVAPGQVSAPDTVTVLFDADPATVAAYTFPAGVTPETPAPASSGLPPGFVVLVSAVFGLVFIGLVATAGFTVLAQRRLRALGVLGAVGATDRQVRLVLVAGGAVVGTVAAVLGTAVGLAVWLPYAPRLSSGTGHRIDPWHLPWWLLGTGAVLSVVTAVLAASRPARVVSRVPVLAALSGHPVPPRAARRLAVPGLVLLVGGPVLLALSGGRSSDGASLALAGLLASILGLLFIAPVTLAVLGRASRYAPVAIRLALRDLARYRARSGSALAATSFAVLVAVFVSILATARYADPLDYFGPNLRADQLVVYAHGTDPNRGPDGPPVPAAHRDLSATAGAAATALGTTDVLELDVPSDAAGGQVMLGQRVSTPDGHDGVKSAGGTLYVATPALLAHFGIDPATVDPDADILTSRAGLDRMSGLVLVGLDPDGPGCPGAHCVAAPRVQVTGALPTEISAPNLLVTEHGLRRIGITARSPAAWLLQTATALTPVQINAARRLVLAAGGSIETRSLNPSLTELRDGATGAGILVALGVLAATVGLIRGEAAGDLRTLAATGAGPRVGRTLTGATAGALGLFGAVLGTAVAYVGAICYYRGSLSTTIAHVPVVDLTAVLVGLPVVATLGGWLFARRVPRSAAPA